MARFKKSEMNKRLREARITAGFATATDAIEIVVGKGAHTELMRTVKIILM